MRLRASESADRIVREATADATRIRNDAEIEVSRQRADAIADAEAEIELARAAGREMVAEARAYREKSCLSCHADVSLPASKLNT